MKKCECGKLIEGQYDDKCQECIDKDWDREMAKEDGKVL